MTLINPILETNQSSAQTKGPIDPSLLGSLKRFLRILFVSSEKSISIAVFIGGKIPPREKRWFEN